MSSRKTVRTCIRAAAILAALVALVAFAAPSAASIAPPAITSPADGAASKPLVRIRGTGTPATTVEVFDAAVSLGNTTVASNTGWALDVTLAQGTHTLTSVARDGTQASAPSQPVTIDVDGTRPTVAVTSPEDDHVFGPGDAVHIEGTASDSRALSAIRLEYWRVGRFDKAELATCACSGATSATWTADPTLDPGEWTLKAYAVDQANNYSLFSQISFVAADADIPFEQPDLSPITGIAPPEILSPEEGKTLPGAERPITIGGSTEAGSTVKVYEQVHGFGWIGTEADAEEDGSWSIDVRLPTGKYGIRALATDEDGNVSDLSELIEFTVDGERPLVGLLTTDKRVFLPLERVVIEGTVTDNFEVTAVVVEYFDVNGKSVLRALATCTGCPSNEASWRHEPSLRFGPGHYTVKVWAFDVAGNGAHKRTLSFIKTI